MQIFKRPVKEVFLFVLLCILCGYSVIKGMQLVAVACIVASICIVYANTFGRFWNAASQLVLTTRQAKLGRLELFLDQKVAGLSIDVARTNPWAAMLLAGLSSEHVALLLTVKRAGTYKPFDKQLPLFRDLRARTLIVHDTAKLSTATAVSLTPLGIELCDIVESVSNDGEVSEQTALIDTLTPQSPNEARQRTPPRADA